MISDGANSSQDENTQLLMQVKNGGCEDAFQRLYEFYYPRLRIFMGKRNVDERTAQDLAQEVMIKVWCKSDQFDPSRANAGAWIFTIARNLLIDRVRQEKRRQIDIEDPLFQLDAPPSAEQSAIAKSDKSVISEALHELPPDQERILRLSFIHGKKSREIAEEMAMPLNTVKSKIRRGVQILRRSMETL